VSLEARIPSEVDVAICGGGLAGLTLARQLRRQLPETSVAVIDALERPLPEAAFKVGESSTEVGSFYLAEVLGLADYLERSHLRKLGFRFFFEPASARFEDRPELGIVDYPVPSSYNFDRGILENDLRRMNAEDGVALLEGFAVTDVALARGEGPHRIALQPPGAAAAPAIAARWLVDAMGRRRFLQGRLGLNRFRARTCNAAWFRLAGRVHVDDLVAPERSEWHARVPGRRRWLSTNHLVGDGYWVWLIPLPSNATSVGIVALEDVHPFAELARFDRVRGWLARHEPHLAAHLAGREPLDFLCIRRYSQSSRRIFSADRWACIGDAAVFSDPLYASATDLLGLENTALVEMIRREREGRLTSAFVSHLNRALIGTNDAITGNVQLSYRNFAHPVAAAAKVAWDTAVAWGLFAPRLFNGIFLDATLAAEIQKLTARAFFLVEKVQALCADWSRQPRRSLSFGFLNLLAIPHLRELRRRNLRPGKTRAELVDDAAATMRTLEELAQILFLLAVEDALPEQRARLAHPLWLNAWAVGLRPERWEAERLFEPESSPCAEALQQGHAAVRALFRTQA
jgi:flavin-dependent dehydrogenase